MQSTKRIKYESLYQTYLKSGATKKEFCLRYGVNESTFEYWISKLRKAGATVESKQFLPIVSETIELELPSGVKLRVKPTSLKAVLHALE